MAQKDEIETADFKVGKSGKKVRAHKVVFNDGDEEHMKKVDEEKMTPTDMAQREKIVKGLKKNYKDFVAKYGERAKAVMYATATSKAMKEESDLEESVYKSRHIHKQEQDKKYDEYRRANEASNKKPLSRGDWAATQRKTALKEESQPTNEATMTSPFDWKKLVTKKDPAKETSTFHDVAKTSTGTKYTKQYDPDGISKGTGQDKAPDLVKRGRGRPKKDKFAEAFEAIASMDENQFDQFVESLNEEAFQAFASALKVNGE